MTDLSLQPPAAGRSAAVAAGDIDAQHLSVPSSPTAAFIHLCSPVLGSE